MATVKALVIGGGGGGGGNLSGYGGGGGAGGYQYNSAFTVTAQTYAVTVGTGGPKGNTGAGTNGNDSVFSTITAYGGGGGGTTTGKDGGCGGGAGGIPSSAGGTGSQGYNGGNSVNTNSGGGGGSGGAGGNNGGAAGIGTSNSITGSAVTYAAGGSSSGGETGTANIGNGGGGAQQYNGDGGKGVVIISYVTADFSTKGISVTGTGNTKTVSGSETICKFITSGNFVVTDSPTGNDLIYYYKLDEASGDAADSVSGVSVTNTSVSYGAGKINNGGIFNGSSSRFSKANFVIPTANFSISAWINADTLPASNGLYTVASKYSTAASTGGFSLALFNNAGTQEVRFTCYNSVTGLDASSNKVVTLSTGVWYHLVGTFDSSVGSKLYINAVNEASANDTGALLNPSARNFTIGCQNYDGTNNVRFFDGIIDEVGMSSRTLSQTDVDTLYNSGAGLQFPFTTTTTPINGNFFMNFI
jgi:hypothetical protein